MKRQRPDKKMFGSMFPMITILGITVIIFCSSFYENDRYFNWSKIRPQIKDTVVVVKNFGIDNKYVGYANIKSAKFERQKWLMQHATAYELLKLTDYPDATIRTIAYEGLLRDPSIPNRVNIVLKAIHDDSSKIYYGSGCTVDKIYIGTYIVENVLTAYFLLHAGEVVLKDEFNFTKAEEEKINSAYGKMLD